MALLRKEGSELVVAAAQDVMITDFRGPRWRVGECEHIHSREKLKCGKLGNILPATATSTNAPPYNISYGVNGLPRIYLHIATNTMFIVFQKQRYNPHSFHAWNHAQFVNWSRSMDGALRKYIVPVSVTVLFKSDPNALQNLAGV